MAEPNVTQFLQEVNEIVQPVQPENPTTREPITFTKDPTVVKPTVRFLLVSTHSNQSNGYSKVAFNILKELAKHPWISLVHYATHKLVNADLGRMLPSTVKVIDASALEKGDKKTGFAITELPAVLQQEKPNVVLIYNDAQMILSYCEAIKKAIDVRPFALWAYVDTTYPMQPVTTIDGLNRDVDRVFAFTAYWKESLKNQGITRPITVMNHGVDTKIYTTESKELSRQRLGLPKEVFLFTSLNKNIPRKRLDLLIMSFVKLIVRHPLKPIFLLLVANKDGTMGGYNLFDIFAREIKLLGEPVNVYGDRLLITSTETCYKDDDINILNNCGDAGISCAEGEGFGLCTFEQMAVGVPQIVPGIGGYMEYCTKENCQLVTPAMRYYIPCATNALSGEARAVDPKDVADAMEQYVFDEKLRKLHATKGKETVVKYTWEKCVAPLVKRLEHVADE